MVSGRWTHDDWVNSGLVEAMPGWADNRGHASLEIDEAGQIDIFYMSAEQEHHEIVESAWGTDFLPGSHGDAADQIGPYPEASFPPDEGWS